MGALRRVYRDRSRRYTRAIRGALFVKQHPEYAPCAMAEPGVELVHRLGESHLELARLGAQNRRHPRPGTSQQPEERGKNYRDADGARDSSFLEPVDALSER